MLGVFRGINTGMNICALTMVYRDHWALTQWYAHYSRHLGAENLFVVAHGRDPEISRLCPGANVITIPRTELGDFDLSRGRLLNGFQIGLSEVYDWIIRTDADELICLDPARYQGFADFFAGQDGKAVFALGFNLAELPEDQPLKPGMLALQHRSRALFSSHYSKAWAVRRRVGLRRHGIEMRRRFTNHYKFSVPRGVYLAHLKFANSQALADADRHRAEIAATAGGRAPGTAWKDPVNENHKFYVQVEQTPAINWDQAESEAHALIDRDPVRDTENGIVRVRSVAIPLASTLPGWFRSA